MEECYSRYATGKFPAAITTHRKHIADPYNIVMILLSLFCLKNPPASVTAAKAAIQPASRDSAIFPLKSRAAGRGKTAKYISPSREAPPAM
jgi:hypothetical protein